MQRSANAAVWIECVSIQVPAPVCGLTQALGSLCVPQHMRSAFF
jgi:hypothetical protein